MPSDGQSGEICCHTCRQHCGLKHGTDCRRKHPMGTQIAIPLSLPAVSVIALSLPRAGFSYFGSGTFSHSGHEIQIELKDKLEITVGGIDTEDLMDWTTMQLEADGTSFGKRILEWISAQRATEPGFLEDVTQIADCDWQSFLPSAEKLGVCRDRKLHISTWGKAFVRNKPFNGEYDFDAGILNGRGASANLRTMTGLSDVIQKNVMCCESFPQWVANVCKKIEDLDLYRISTKCTKGRHRSVAAAEILKKLYYNNATITHLTMFWDS